MIRFKISADRMAEACNILEYLALTGGSIETSIRVAPRFMLGDSEEYIVKIVLDEDGDIASMDGLSDAFARMSAVTPKRLEKLGKELTEAAKALISPLKGGG